MKNGKAEKLASRNLRRNDSHASITRWNTIKCHLVFFPTRVCNWILPEQRIIQKSEITMEVGGSRFNSEFFLENRPKIALKQYWCFGVVYHVYSVCTLLKVVGYYDLSVLSTQYQWWMGFQKIKCGWGVGGWGELYPISFGFLEMEFF